MNHWILYDDKETETLGKWNGKWEYSVGVIRLCSVFKHLKNSANITNVSLSNLKPRIPDSGNQQKMQSKVYSAVDHMLLCQNQKSLKMQQFSSQGLNILLKTEQEVKKKRNNTKQREPRKSTIVMDAPRILRSSRKIILWVSEPLKFQIWYRDVRKAFMQSDFPLKRQLYIKPPKVLDLFTGVKQRSDGYLSSFKPIYGLSQSPRYWWHTFKRYHSEHLEMDQSRLDPFLFNRKSGKALIGLVGTLIDDTLAARNLEFSQIEYEKCKAFDVKPRDQDLSLKFAGVSIMMQGGIMVME